MFRSESQGEKPAFLQMNQNGTIVMARPIRMKMGKSAMTAKAIF